MPKINTYDKMAAKYGAVTVDGVTVALTEQAYADNYGTDGGIRYYAHAVDHAGTVYMVTWVTVDGWADHLVGEDGNCKVAGCDGSWCEDESNACHWDKPISVEVAE